MLYAFDRRIRFVNAFAYGSPEDFLYYLLFVLDEVLVSPVKAKVTVWGLSADDPALKLAARYIKDLTVGKKPLHLKFPSYQFDEVPDERDFDLFSAYDLDR